MNKMQILLVLAASASAVIGQPALTQVAPDSVQERNDCRLARQILVHGQPANKRAWALAKLPNCGRVGAEVVQHYLARNRADETFRGALDEVISASLGLVDRSVAFTALSVAIDQSAGTAARIQALRLLYAQVVPTTTVTYQRFTRPEIVGVTTRDAAGNEHVRVEPLEPDMVTDRFMVVVTPLAISDVEQIATAVRGLMSAAHHPELRLAAERTVAAFRSYLRCSPGTRSTQDCIRRLRGETSPQ